MAVGLSTPGAEPDSVDTALALKSTLASPTFTGTVGVPSYTVATLPAASTVGQVVVVSDAVTTGYTLCVANGTNWIDVNTGTTVTHT